MRKYFLFSIFFSTFVACYSCDDGRIYEKEVTLPQEGLTLKLTGHLTGVDTWPEKYTLCVAGFTDESDYAVLSKVIASDHAAGGEVEVVLSGIKEEVTQLELCVTNRLRKRIVTFAQMEVAARQQNSDTLTLDVGSVDVGMYRTLQEEVFNASCIACHGANGRAARDLFLTEGQSYKALVGQASKVHEAMLLVAPGEASESLLPQVLSEEGLVQHSHTDLLDAKKKSTLLTLINDWIDAGAKE